MLLEKRGQVRLDVGTIAQVPHAERSLPLEPSFVSPQAFLAWGGVGRQTSFSFAKPADIRQEVRHRIKTLGRAGLIICPAYDIDEPDVPWENIAAFLEAAEIYG